MRLRLPDAVRRLARDATGVSIIEFALFAPILGVMVMGVTDVAMSYATKLRFEQAAYGALEKVSATSVQTDYTYLRADAAEAAGVPISAVSVDAWLECDGVQQGAFTGVCADDAVIARYVRLTIDSGYRPTFPYGPLGAATRSDGTMAVTASAAVRIQ